MTISTQQWTGPGPVAVAVLWLLTAAAAPASYHEGENYPGLNCCTCHFPGSGLPVWDAGGTVFETLDAVVGVPGLPVRWLTALGEVELEALTNEVGNIAVPELDDGSYLIELDLGDSATSRTWHDFPARACCTECHVQGGNRDGIRDRVFPDYHPQQGPDNDCQSCHHFPASQALENLATEGVLNTASPPPGVQTPSGVLIEGEVHLFDPAEHTIETLRPDIFAPGYFSLLDVILAVGEAAGYTFDVVWDEESGTHFIEAVNGLVGDYWYHFSYDVGSGDPGQAVELSYRRADRWDELRWKPGTWIQLVAGEDLAAIKVEYREEIERERLLGSVVPLVIIGIRPSDYRGNPPESGRITVWHRFFDVSVTAHDLRALGAASPYSKIFQPGVVTAIDVLLSLQDQGELDVVDTVFFDVFGERHVDSYFVVGMGFPGDGLAHASGTHGFNHLTTNGSIFPCDPESPHIVECQDLPNDADPLQHIPADELVIHAPDLARWAWRELYDPYFEDEDPMLATVSEQERDRILQQEWDALGDGFNCHPPRKRRDSDVWVLSYNVFEPGSLELTIRDLERGGRLTVLDRFVADPGVDRLTWSAETMPPGRYELTCRRGEIVKTRAFEIVRREGP